MSKIKICGLFRECDIEYVNLTKPDYAGFIIDFPKSHRSIDYSIAKTLISKLDSDIKSVCVFINEDIEFIKRFDKICDIIQLHGNEDNEYIDNIKLKLPKKEIWKAFKVRTYEDLKKAIDSKADRILLDNGYGTGTIFDWNIINNFNREFILAGGINISNIKNAIDRFSPSIIDISSGVESNKVKDFNKIKKIISIVKGESNE